MRCWICSPEIRTCLDVPVQFGHVTPAARQAETSRARGSARVSQTSRRTLTPPGSVTGPWPCQSVSRASSARTCSAESGPAPTRGRPQAQHAGADRGVQGGRPGHRQRRGLGHAGPDEGQEGLRRLLVQRVDVVAEQVGGAGERLDHPAAQDVLEQRQHLVPQPGPPEAGIGVVRVVPRLEPERGARPTVVVRRRPRKGRANRVPSTGRMPAIERGPEPRPSPSSTVSAWSSAVWASRTRAPSAVAAASRAS